MSNATKCVDPRVIAARPAHALNDALVTLRAGARAENLYARGAAMLGGSGRQGYVHGVQGGMALVDFGRTDSGVQLRVMAAVADLEAV